MFVLMVFCFCAFIVVSRNYIDGNIVEYTYREIVDAFDAVCKGLGAIGVYRRGAMDDFFSFTLSKQDNSIAIEGRQIAITPFDRGNMNSILLYELLSEHKRNILEAKGLHIKKYKLSEDLIWKIASERADREIDGMFGACARYSMKHRGRQLEITIDHVEKLRAENAR